MNCRHCNTREEETHEHLEICPGTAHLRIKLDIEKEHDHMVLLRKLNRKLKEITAKEEHAKNIKSCHRQTKKRGQDKEQQGIRDPSESRHCLRAA